MYSKSLSLVFAALCLSQFLIQSQCVLIKGKNVPRVGRSNEADGPYDHTMGYVIKTIPNKNIPRMGRRNYDSENRYDIPKFYQLPLENPDIFEDEDALGYNQEQIEAYYGNPMEKK